MTTERPAAVPAARAPLQTADRVLQVLLAFSQERDEWGVTDLAAEYGWDKSVAQRLLASLAHRGFLVSDEITRRYRLGPAVWHMATAWERHGGMAALVRPALRRLAAATGATALFAVPDGAHLRCVESADGAAGPLRAYHLADELYPAHAGATSRAYFGMLSPGARAELVYGRPMARFSELTVTSPELLEELMCRVPVDGYAFSQGEYDPATAALAVAVMVRSQPVASLTLVGSHELLDAPHEELLRPLRAAADALADLLTPRRHRPAPPAPPATVMTNANATTNTNATTNATVKATTNLKTDMTNTTNATHPEGRRPV